MDFSRKHLIYGALTFVSLLGAILKVTYFAEPGRTAIAFYCGVMYIVFLLWAVGQLRAINEREHEEKALLPGGAAAFFESSAIRPDESALIAAETYLSVGESLETICRFIEPRYADWTPSERQAYRLGLRAALDERRSIPPLPEQQENG
jgi:hypothetical protein